MGKDSEKPDIKLASSIQLIVLEFIGRDPISGDYELDKKLVKIESLQDLAELRSRLTPLEQAEEGDLVEAGRYPICDQLFAIIMSGFGLLDIEGADSEESDSESQDEPE